MSMLNETMLVSDVMLKLDRAPVVQKDTLLKRGLEVMSQTNLGIVCIVGDENKLLGILTDGDIRRKLLKVQKPFSAFFVDDAIDHAIRTPVTIKSSDTLAKAVQIMGEKRIWDLPVIDGSEKLVGLLHLHPAVQALLDTQ